MTQVIEIVRGTTNTLEINVTDANGVAYTTAAGEKIVFGVKKKPGDTELLIVKTASFVTVGTYLVTLDPDDTANLAYGRYMYDVGLQSGNAFYNIVEPSYFVVTDNVTSRGCAS